MNQLYLLPADFEAVIRIYSSEEGGRRTPVFNRIRWDFAYADWPQDKSPEIFMIWPDFFDEKGDFIDRYEPLPTGIELQARMTIVNRDKHMREFHRQRIRAGICFYCHEGARRVASGRVVGLTGLNAL